MFTRGKDYVIDSQGRAVIRVAEKDVEKYLSAPDLYEFARQMERSGLLEELPNWLEGLRNILAKVEGK